MNDASSGPVSRTGTQCLPLELGNTAIGKSKQADGGKWFYAFARQALESTARPYREPHCCVFFREVFWKLDIGDISAQVLGY